MSDKTPPHMHINLNEECLLQFLSKRHAQEIPQEIHKVAQIAMNWDHHPSGDISNIKRLQPKSFRLPTGGNPSTNSTDGMSLR